MKLFIKKIDQQNRLFVITIDLIGTDNKDP